MARRRTPPRDSKGRFKKRGRAPSRKRRKTRRARRNPSTRTASSRRSAPRARRNPPRDAFGRFKGRGGTSRRRARRNPPGRGGMFAHLWDGAIAATQITVGKAASRSLPTFFGLPQQGMTGLAVRAATGVALGWVVENVSPIRVWGLGEKLTEGALVGAIEDLMVAYHVPWIGPALAAPPGMLLGTGGGTTGGGRYQLASGTTRAPASRMLTGGRYDRTLSGGRPSRGNVGAVPSQGMPTQSYYG